ncbi:MAG: MBL fold metallo-hydrolase [Dehalococcoidales bacterium]|nr:MBL fold metallo-hydrolase [Dehalococcoidales bacterium]
MEKETSSNETITFLGTGGARFMIISQALASGGIWFNLDGTQLLMDPGPGSIVQVTKRKLNPEKLSGIIVSHRHLDHSADVNVMTEAMTQGGFKKQGILFAPRDAIETEPILFNYLKRSLEGIEILEEGKTYYIGKISFTTPVRHIHMVENYGMVFRTEKHSIAYITDTRYFEGLADYYHGDLLMLNLTFLEPHKIPQKPGMPLDHLSVPDAELLIKEIKPKTAILTHFGMGIWRAKPWLVAEQLTEKTGIKVIAARDGMKFDLAELDKI